MKLGNPVVLALGLLSAVMAGSAHGRCNIGGEHRFIGDLRSPHARQVCIAEGKILCQLDGAFDTWCQAQPGQGSVSVACESKEGPSHCCTGWAGSGLPPESAKCRLGK